MKNAVSIIVCAAICALASCSPKVTSNILRTYPSEKALEDVVVLNEKENVPANAEWIGSIEVRGKANYDRMAELTRFRAWESGAKYVKVNHYGSDGVRSDIHVMSSDAYRIDTAKHVAVPISSVNDGYDISGSSNGMNAGSMSNDVGQTESNHSFASAFGFRVYSGYGRRLNKINPDLNEFEQMHIKRLMNGVVLGADGVYYFNSSKTCGLGLKYQIMHGSSTDLAEVKLTNGTVTGQLNDKVNISYVGPIYSMRSLSSNGENIFMFDVGLGLLNYKAKSTINDLSSSINGWTTGLTLDVNYSRYLSKKLLVGFSLSLTSGTLTSYEINDGGTKQTVNLDEKEWEGLFQMGAFAQLVYTF